MKTETKTYVGFVADFPTETGPDSPPGKELAQFVHSKLVNNGWHVGPPSNREDWAWEWYWTNGNVKLMTIIALVDDMNTNPPRQWLITNDFSVPLLKRIFGGSKSKAELQILSRKFCETIHNVFKSDSRFSHIVWYDASTFDKPGDAPGHEP